ARSQGNHPLSFVGSAKLNSDIEATAAAIRTALGFDLEDRRKTWTDALRYLIQQADALGILVMVSVVVGNNNYRKLDSAEFRGFALADDLAPLVFINGADSKAAQMFTLAHELAHLWLGRTALSDVRPVTVPTHDVEHWCSQVAAELLVPLAVLRVEYEPGGDLRSALDRLARRFKVSTLVILRRIHDARGLTRDQLWQAYQQELQRLGAKPRRSGGNFYLTQSARMGKRFARALVAGTLEGHTPAHAAFCQPRSAHLQDRRHLILGEHFIRHPVARRRRLIGFGHCPAPRSRAPTSHALPLLDVRLRGRSTNDRDTEVIANPRGCICPEKTVKFLEILAYNQGYFCPLMFLL